MQISRYVLHKYALNAQLGVLYICEYDVEIYQRDAQFVNYCMWGSPCVKLHKKHQM